MATVTGWKRYTVVCAKCGIESLKSNKTETCSMKCRGDLRLERQMAAAPTDACPVCAEVCKLPWLAKGAPVCSQRCKSIVYARVRADRDWATWREKYAKTSHVLGTSRHCDWCQKGYTVKRHDQRFCGLKCLDNWNYHEGVKGQNRRSKTRDALERRNLAIGSCALCQTPSAQIHPSPALGRRAKNGTAIFHKDHVTAKSKGGTDEPSNLRYLCWFCNIARMDADHAHDHAVAAAGRAFWAAINGVELKHQTEGQT